MENKYETRIMFSQRLSLLIKYKGLTNTELAKAIEVSTGLITKYTTGKASPSYENFVKIADYFEVSMDYLRGKSNSFSDNPIDKQQINSWMSILESLDLDEKEEKIILKALRLINKKMDENSTSY
jgi:transcriptional regulator with XRE-family HTH domain